MIYGMRPYRPSVSVAALVLMYTCLCLTKSVFAEDHSTGTEIQVELTLSQLVGQHKAARFDDLIPSDERITWQVYLPNNDTSALPGVFVYVSPTISGQIYRRWKKVMDEQNLIYIAADRSGNRKPVVRRMVLATMAIRVLAQRYAFDDKNMVVSGFSGGGRVASKLATQYPEVFAGALYICGVDFWKKSQTPRVDRLIQNRFVFLTGSKDFNRDETQQIYRKYLKAGASNSKLMIIPNSDHELPNADNLNDAIEFLQARN